MNIVFFGSSGFAVPSLRALNEGGYNISCVITQTDKKKGRGLHLEPTPVKLAANELGLNIHQPVDINASEEIKSLKSLNTYLSLCVYAFPHSSNCFCRIYRRLPFKKIYS